MSEKQWVFAFQGRLGQASLNGKWLTFEGLDRGTEWRATIDLEEASHISFTRWPKSMIPIYIGIVSLISAYFAYDRYSYQEWALLGVFVAVFSFLYYWVSVGKLAIFIAMPSERLTIEGSDSELKEFYWLLETAWVSHRPSRKGRDAPQKGLKPNSMRATREE